MVLSNKVAELCYVAEWAAYNGANGYESIYADALKIIKDLNPNFVPSENLQLRSLFLKMLLLLRRCSSNQEQMFLDILNLEIQIERLFKEKHPKSIPPYKLLLIRRSIIAQIAICKLMRHMEVQDDPSLYDPSTLLVPQTFNYNDTDEPSEEFHIDCNAATKNLITHRDDGKKVFSKVRVIHLIETHSLLKFKNSLTEFFRNIESIMLPEPMLSISFNERISEDSKIVELLRSNKKPDWTEKQRESEGPYRSAIRSSSKVNTAPGTSEKISEHSIIRRLSDSFQQQATASKLPLSPPNHKNGSSPPSVHRHTQTTSDNSVRGNNTLQNSADKPKCFIKAAVALQEKYDALDPLNEILGLVDANQVDGYHARMSRNDSADGGKKGSTTKGASKRTVTSLDGSDNDDEVNPKKKKATRKQPARQQKAAVSTYRNVGRGEKVLFGEEEDDDRIEEFVESDLSDSESDYQVASRKRLSTDAVKKLNAEINAAMVGRSGDDIRRLSAASSSNGARKRWTYDEEEALIDGVKIHGVGNWATILRDSRFDGVFHAGRTNVNLKDKYRNLEKVGRV